MIQRQKLLVRKIGNKTLITLPPTRPVSMAYRMIGMSTALVYQSGMIGPIIMGVSVASVGVHML
jgi:hypothetical protein